MALDETRRDSIQRPGTTVQWCELVAHFDSPVVSETPEPAWPAYSTEQTQPLRTVWRPSKRHRRARFQCLRAKFRYPSEDGRPANASLGVPGGGLANFLWCEPSPSGSVDRSPRSARRERAYSAS